MLTPFGLNAEEDPHPSSRDLEENKQEDAALEGVDPVQIHG